MQDNYLFIICAVLVVLLLIIVGLVSSNNTQKDKIKDLSTLIDINDKEHKNREEDLSNIITALKVELKRKQDIDEKEDHDILVDLSYDLATIKKEIFEQIKNMESKLDNLSSEIGDLETKLNLLSSDIDSFPDSSPSCNLDNLEYKINNLEYSINDIKSSIDTIKYNNY